MSSAVASGEAHPLRVAAYTVLVSAAAHLKQAIERKHRKHVDLQPLPESHVRLLVEIHSRSVLQCAPDEVSLTEPVGIAQDKNVAVRRLRDVRESQGNLARQLLALDDQPDLRIEVQRALIEVHRTDEHSLAIEYEHLGVQRILPGAQRSQSRAPSDRRAK